MNMAFSNARLIDPANGLDEPGTLVVEKGKISAIGKNAKVPDKMKSHDCNGMAILYCAYCAVLRSTVPARDVSTGTIGDVCGGAFRGCG